MFHTAEAPLVPPRCMLTPPLASPLVSFSHSLDAWRSVDVHRARLSLNVEPRSRAVLRLLSLLICMTQSRVFPLCLSYDCALASPSLGQQENKRAA